MLSYEYALKITKAGFPAKETTMLVHKYTEDGEVFAPSLDELIEACGNEFKNLTLILSNNDGNYWRATGMTKTLEEKYYRSQVIEDSVAGLYLKLQENETKKV